MNITDTNPDLYNAFKGFGVEFSSLLDKALFSHTFVLPMKGPAAYPAVCRSFSIVALAVVFTFAVSFGTKNSGHIFFI